jgi:SAM-dependent methyltransferase
VEALHAALRPYAEHDYANVASVLDPSHRSVIDAGGGSGALARALLRAWPHVTVTVLDRSEVVAQGLANDNWGARLGWMAGDLFAPWPVRAEAIVLARVLHDWPDDEAVAILRNARENLMPGGRLYVVEMVREAGNFEGALLSLHLLLSTGGRERTRAEFEALLARAGLRLVEVRALAQVSDVLVVEAA